MYMDTDKDMNIENGYVMDEDTDMNIRCELGH